MQCSTFKKATMSGRIGDLTVKQQKILNEFRQNLSDVLSADHDDHYLLRWLRARKFDLSKSEKMLRDHLTFRKRMNIDKILEWTPPEVITKYMTGGICGHHKGGGIIWIEPFGRIDPKGIVRSCSKSDFVKYRTKMCEEILKDFREQSEKLGKIVDDVIIIIDLDKIEYQHVWKPLVDCYNAAFTMFEPNYPEILKTCFVLNAPSMMSVGFNLVKPFLSEDTTKKVKFLKSNQLYKLLEYIDPDQLPKVYGGTRTDSDGCPDCKEEICWGGKVPSSYYLNQEIRDNNNFDEVSVGSKSSHHIKLDVTQENSIIRWEFHSDEPILFGIYKKNKAGKEKEKELKVIQTKAKYNSQEVPESGAITCIEVGTYVLKFENTNIVQSKKLMYQVDVLTPTDEQTTEIQSNGAIS
ncbi:SEC14-like protein 2 [Anneissia japonica]|uniref:SEC14-like protein 2 n=1 Tax=Anneissia japonica TaxID=1529436 RepID=UPI0014257208|nr:SEC14-like protein 2 [Anneissia japonica]